MNVLFLKVEAIKQDMDKSGKKYEIIKTDLDKPVARRSLDLWKSRGFYPAEKGIAYVRFEGKEKVYQYPLFFDVQEST
jgi:hypothetical protein